RRAARAAPRGTLPRGPRRRLPRLVQRRGQAARHAVPRRGGHRRAPRPPVAQRRRPHGPGQRPRPARRERAGADVTGAPWSSGVERGAAGALTVAGVDVRDLAAEHGTPAYVLDEADFRRRAQAYRTAFEAAFGAVGTGVDVYYAGKALLTVAVARWAREEGLRVDTASGGELAVALRAQVPGAEIGLHGNNKSDAEILRALDAGVGRIIVDSLVEIERIAQLAAGRGVVAPVMVRVTTGVHAGG